MDLRVAVIQVVVTAVVVLSYVVLRVLHVLVNEALASTPKRLLPLRG